MIFTNKTSEEIKRDEMTWKPCFAWYPVRVSPTEKAWLERIEYRITGYDSCPSIDGGCNVYPVHEYRKAGTQSNIGEIQ